MRVVAGKFRLAGYFLAVAGLVAGCASAADPNMAKEVGNPGIFYERSQTENMSSSDEVELRFRAQQEILERQRLEAERQAREIDDLKRQEYHNQHLKMKQ